MRNEQQVNAVPTHYTLKMADIAEISNTLNNAIAILTLVQNDGDDEGFQFHTSEEIIRTALSVVNKFIKQAEQASKRGIYS